MMTGFICNVAQKVFHTSASNIFSFFFLRRQGLSPSYKGKTGQSGSQETALIMSAREARQCSLACNSSASCPGEPSRPLTPPALFVTRMPGREAGSWGQGLCAPLTGKGHRRGLVGPLRDDREVRGPLGRGGVEAVEPLLKHSSACYPTPREGRGSPSANWY